MPEPAHNPPTIDNQGDIMTTMHAPTIAPAHTQEAPFSLTITRRVYSVDCMTGVKQGHYVRNWKLVG
jgi:hypothetical protein